MTPAEGLELKARAGQVQDEQQQRMDLQSIRQIFQAPDAFDPQTGVPTTQTISRIGQVNPREAFQWDQQRRMALSEVERTKRAQLMADAKQASAKTQQEYQQARADQLKTRAAKDREALHASMWHDVMNKALAVYDAALAKGPSDEAERQYRQAFLDEIEQGEKSGRFIGSGMKQEALDVVKSKIPPPDVARNLAKSAKEREIQLKSDLNSPIVQTRLDQSQQRINLQDIGQQMRGAQADRKLDQGDTKLAQGDRTLDLREKHQSAQERLKQADQELKAETAETTAEERERHNRAVEDARKEAISTRRELYGKVTMNSKGEPLVKPPSGYEWDPDDPGTLRPIRGGPKDMGHMASSPRLTNAQIQKRTKGMVEAGNIDLYNRPIVKNADGSISTVRSMSFHIDGREVLIPTVAEDGSRILSDEEAIEQYRRTGKHLGKFETPGDADNYARQLHKDQEKLYAKGGTAKMSLAEVKQLREKESEMATLNRELEQGKITQEQHDARIAKLNAQGKGGKDGQGTIIIGGTPPKGFMFNPDPEKEGTLVPIPGGPMDPAYIAQASAARGRGGTGKGGHEAQPVEQEFGDLHGAEFLAKLKPRYADLVKAVGDGRIRRQDAVKDLPAKLRATFDQDVLQYKPDYKDPVREKMGGGNPVDEETAKWIAQQVWAGDRQAAVGWARSPEAHARIARAIREEGQKRGADAKQLAVAMMNYEGARAGSRTLGTRSANIGVAINELDRFATIGLAASEKVPRTNFVPINKLMRIGREQWSPEQAAFEAANRSIINAFAQVAARSGNATVHNTQEAEHMLNTAQTAEQYKAVIKQLQAEAQGAREAVGDTRDELGESVTGRKAPPPSAGAGTGKPRAPTRETPDSKIGAPGPYSDPEKEKRYQEWKKKHGQ